MEEKEKRIYTIATAHLDTSWLWTLEKTVEDYLPHTLSRNFSLFEKYPDYKFNFEGAYRYQLIEEYYPEQFEELKKYISEGKWVPCGSSYENGDVNIPSPESILRNIMYGNRYFKEKFGITCNDIFLPDCFGFGYALPSIAAHAGLKGFSTQKLSWGGAYPVPFDIGKWVGVDGNSVYACLKPFAYGTVLSSVRRNAKYLKKLSDNLTKYNLPYTFIYHGTGDRGGSPSEFSVRNAIAELSVNDNNDIKVLSASTQEFFSDMEKLTEEEQKTLPEWNNELLLTEHGAGCYTARTANKRFNRRNELLADAAERTACAAMCVNSFEYPQYTFDSAWKKVLSHHFHDDITGTSFTECYKRSQNDYIQSLNAFSNEYTAACKSVSDALDSSFCKGIPVVVSNPMQCAGRRTEAVYSDVEAFNGKSSFRVFDSDGNEVFSQCKKLDNEKIRVTFLADVPSVGMRLYDIRPSDFCCSMISGLKVTASTLENEKYRVYINANGDIADIFDKLLRKSVLAAPIRLCIHNDLYSFNYPAWEMKYKDIISPVRETPGKPRITIEDFGPARISLRIERKTSKSAFSQIVSLDEAGDTIRVFNEVDWRDTGSMLKAEFPLSAFNAFAAYDIGLGVINRGNNTDRMFEVPSQLWADITDENGEFGISVFSDSKTGWDKPADNILRLTAIHTPLSNYRWECSQHLLDFGLNRFSFGIFIHQGDYSHGTQLAANNFAQPMNTFILSQHKGKRKTEYSFASVSNDNCIIRAIKKAQDSDNIVVRVNNGYCEKSENIILTLADGIMQAFEADGCENYKCEAQLQNGQLIFNLLPFEIKTFIISVNKTVNRKKPGEIYFELPGNTTAITSQNNFAAAALSVPRELMPDVIYSGGVHFRIISHENKNALSCTGQTFDIPKGANTAELLISRTAVGKDVAFMLEGKISRSYVPSAYEHTGAWDLIALGQTGYINKTPLAFSAAHSHCRKGDITEQQYNIYRITLDVSDKEKLSLPDDSDTIIFALTFLKEKAAFKESSEHYDSLEKRSFDYKLTESERTHAEPAAAEKLLNKFISRKQTKFIDLPFTSSAIQPAEVYYAVRSFFDKMQLKRKIRKLTD